VRPEPPAAERGGARAPKGRNEEGVSFPLTGAKCPAYIDPQPAVGKVTQTGAARPDYTDPRRFEP
jgi:hypothetical protein